MWNNNLHLLMRFYNIKKAFLDKSQKINNNAILFYDQNFAKIALNAEHGLFFVMKPKLGELYADYYEEGVGADKDVLFKKNVKIKLGQEDLVSMVARKGMTINVRNAYKDRRVPQDKKKGYIIRSVLCMPIRGIDEIMGKHNFIIILF